ncbi:hypothetical protein RFI_17521 [Reticulomyxa filosa]|uniref:C2 domain-containing protein n=1 Tax=Reticulomyxa filosa TaxID=46433 RepID=X6N0A6_RETFI|nr:hypothetical protein RFI_17521 [Reticulomyxa filosa]|eukprot:ETO19710.1 hypothetical protein RFI_17521 [Reticulomyxa filosa]
MPKRELLAQFHHLFWVGDLNYRINWQPDEDTKLAHKDNCDPEIFGAFQSHLNEKTLKNVLKDDQLVTSMIDLKAFVGFREPDLRFLPTFKVEKTPGLHYNVCYTYAHICTYVFYSKQFRCLLKFIQPSRLPAWCDRILYRSAAIVNPPKVLSYSALPNVPHSDHKPVESHMNIEIWNRPSGIDDSISQAVLHFQDCSAEGLLAADVSGFFLFWVLVFVCWNLLFLFFGSFSGTSDPYLHWPKQPLLEKPSNSRRKNKTLHPEWNDSRDFEPLLLLRNSIAFMTKALLFLEMRDHDHLSKDELIGQGYLPLAPALDNIGKWQYFEVELTFSGLYAGKFQGRYKIVINDESSKTDDNKAAKKIKKSKVKTT